MKSLLKLILSFSVMVFALTACSTGERTQIGDNTLSFYDPPATYQDHRSQQKLFSTFNGNIAYTDHGHRQNQTGEEKQSPQVLVLLHGVPTSSWMYRKIIPGLQQNIRVISIDLLGYGSSDKPKNGDEPYSHALQAARVEALLSHLEIEKFSLLMHDMGGLVAWEILRNQAENVSHLIVLNTIINKEGFNNPNINAGFFTRQMMKAYRSPLTSAAILKKTFDDLGLVDEYELTETECYGYVAPMKEGSDPALYAFFTQLNPSLFTRLNENKTLLNNYQGNTLVLWGAKDTTLTTKQIPVLQKMLAVPNENIHIYPDNAHFLAEEIPDEIIKQVNAFLGATL